MVSMTVQLTPLEMSISRRILKILKIILYLE